MQTQAGRTRNAGACACQSARGRLYRVDHIGLARLAVFPFGQTHDDKGAVGAVAPADKRIDRDDVPVVDLRFEGAFDHGRLFVGVGDGRTLWRGDRHEGDSPILAWGKLAWQRLIQENGAGDEQQGKRDNDQGQAERGFEAPAIGATET